MEWAKVLLTTFFVLGYKFAQFFAAFGCKLVPALVKIIRHFSDSGGHSRDNLFLLDTAGRLPLTLSELTNASISSPPDAHLI